MKQDKTELWQKFLELRDIRNNFVHRGSLELNGQMINLELARQYLANSKDIISFIESVLPKEITRPISTDKYEMEAFQLLVEPTVTETNIDSNKSKITNT